MLSGELIYLYNNGKCYHAYRTFGAHPVDDGTQFTIWIPGVRNVKVTGDFTDWIPGAGIDLEMIGDTGVYTGFVPGAVSGNRYKYDIELWSGEHILKSDPFAFSSEPRPGTASVISDLAYKWNDAEWISSREKSDTFREPMNIYEVHLGSWEREPG